ncbi:hypothetical protein [Rhodopirellula sp. P2]|uniref:hypothetical protein n=1 Tax=Rhodopirellula sp. P2 TaxID=2127060 RepID=UPI002368BC8D|nr:hypothetical protein [Rhodopirellula sp. P2]WDQ15756.1 hypothetical protein PSR62_19225 [Rhodopirellula sp. P2]
MIIWLIPELPIQASADDTPPTTATKHVDTETVAEPKTPDPSSLDRVTAFIPLPSAADPPPLESQSESPGAHAFQTAEMSARADSPNPADEIWSAYIDLWKSHHATPSQRELRTLFGLPADADVLITDRRGRVAPSELQWRPGSFRVWQTDHFEILSQADDVASRTVAEALEREYWVWTQIFFPIWSGRSQVASIVSDWDRQSTTAVDHLKSRSSPARLAHGQRHRVVLLADQESYRATIASAFRNTDTSAVAASTGFYSDTLRLSFFFPQRDLASLHHEICHQLFTEASANASRRRPTRGQTFATATTEDFWLIEGMAGYFESLRYERSLAYVGGWESPRLQLARYQALIGGVPIASLDDLRGTRDQVQSKPDLARWYSQSALRTHYLMDAAGPPQRRRLLKQLADLYSHPKPADTTGTADDVAANETNPAAILRYLRVDDAHLNHNPAKGDLTTLCLAGCNLTGNGLAKQKRIHGLTWCDLSRLPLTDADVLRLVADTEQLDQLSLEATQVTNQIATLLQGANQLRELDLSYTAIDDSVLKSIPQSASTLWMTGTNLTDQAIDTLIALPRLKTIDLQRTKITERGLQRFRQAKPDCQLNPLNIPE